MENRLLLALKQLYREGCGAIRGGERPIIGGLSSALRVEDGVVENKHPKIVLFEGILGNELALALELGGDESAKVTL